MGLFMEAVEFVVFVVPVVVLVVLGGGGFMVCFTFRLLIFACAVYSICFMDSD